MSAALLDTNVLVHAANVDSPRHLAASTLVNRGLRKSAQFCIAPQNLIEFAAIVTRPRFVARPMAHDDLMRIGELLYKSRRLAKIYPRRGTVIRALHQGTALGMAGPIWYDLFLAITMLDAGVETIITENLSDFRKFPFITALSIDDAIKSVE
jgi:predicted nucleic acid-binding protein